MRSEPWAVEKHGLLLPAGTAATPPAARVVALDWLVKHGCDEWEATAEVDAYPVTRAWWNDELGFVQRGHGGAEPVIVVAVPDALLEQATGELRLARRTAPPDEPPVQPVVQLDTGQLERRRAPLAAEVQPEQRR
jgi:hypothetical protein